MEGRRVSSLSAGSNESETSSGPRTGELFLEEVGQVDITEAASPRCLSCLSSLLCLLAGDTHIWVAEFRLRTDAEVSPSRSALLALPGLREDKHYLSACLLAPGPQARLALLGERKNKERFVSVVELSTQGRGLALGEELAVYDKVAMLGKGLSHLACSPGGEGEDLYVFGSIVRKLKVEEEGRLIRPTTGKVAIPPECADGTLAVCVTGSSSKKGASVLCSSRTKSAGKNKFQLNWFQVKKDELSAPSGKAALKLPEEQEPTVLLSDPRDPRVLYMLCNSPGENTASLYRMARGRKPEEAVHTFPFLVTEAAFLAGPDKTQFLFLLEQGSLALRVLQLSRAEGYRGQEAAWSRAPHLHLGPGPTVQALNCSQAKWQVPAATADAMLALRAPYQVGLATLISPQGDIATEPESGLPYRLRLLGGDQCNDVLLILLEDLERSWEGEEEQLASSSLKLCVTTSPAREGLNQLSAWLMGGRLAAVEIQVARPERDCPGGSERLAIVTLSPDTLRSHLVEQDWTQSRAREGTFVLEAGESGGTSLGNSLTNSMSTSSSTSPAAIRSSSTPLSGRTNSAGGPRTRIPSASHRRSPGPDVPHTNGTNGSQDTEDMLSALARVEEAVSPLARASTQMRENLALLEKNLAQLRIASNRSLENSVHE